MKNFFKTQEPVAQEHIQSQEVSIAEEAKPSKDSVGKKTSFLGGKLKSLTEKAQGFSSEGLAKISEHASNISETLNLSTAI
jgi:predicted nuclease of restriction endonuclease-like RecB superfamily